MRRTIFFIIFLLAIQLTAGIKVDSNTLGFEVQYKTVEIPVTSTDVMLSKDKKPYANVDYIAVKSGNTILPLTSAKQKGKSVLNKVGQIDNDVIDLHEPIQLKLPITGTLLINANEHGQAGPVRYPQDGFITMELPAGNPTHDGILDAGLGQPTFKFWWEPTTGHPAGWFIVYAFTDANYAYFAFDVTPDNTNDAKEDWSAIHVQTNEGIKEFYADHAKKEYGLSSFGYTGSVNYAHKTYEFKIPLNEIGPFSLQSTTIIFYLQYYGTAGGPVCGNGILEAPEECDDGNLIGGDGCSSTCTLEGAVPEFSTITLIIAVLGALVGIFAVRKIR